MNSPRQRLERCFFVVFPKLDRSAVSQATVDTVERWDSLASIRLGTVIEEEFGVPVDAVDLVDLRSFADFERFLTQHGQ